MLENFHNTLLAYCPKHCAFGYFISTVFLFNFFGCRDEAYRSRILLTVLDHNSHLGRLPKQNSDCSLQYHRRFRRQTKNWDVVRVLEKKQYEYMPRLLQQIVDHWTSSDYLMEKFLLWGQNQSSFMHSTNHCKYTATRHTNTSAK